MNLFLALALGVVGGIVGVIPFLVARGRIKAKLKEDGIGSIIVGMIAIMISFVIMVVEIILFNFIAPEHLLPFAITTIVVFVLAVGIYTATMMRR